VSRRPPSSLAQAPAADQFRDRHAQALPRRIQQRRLDRAFGDRVGHHVRIDTGHHGADAADVHAREQRRDIGVDQQFDPFRVLGTIAGAADGGAFADTLNPIGAGQPDDDDGLAIHRRHRQHMRADGRQIDQHGLDLEQLYRHVWMSSDL
jgi:hypothetical protein